NIAVIVVSTWRRRQRDTCLRCASFERLTIGEAANQVVCLLVLEIAPFFPTLDDAFWSAIAQLSKLRDSQAERFTYLTNGSRCQQVVLAADMFDRCLFGRISLVDGS